MIKALSVPSSKNLQPLSRYLHGQHVPHRISERGGDQVVWVGSEKEVALVQACYERLLEGNLLNRRAEDESLPPQDSWSLQRIWLHLQTAPLVASLIIASAVISFLNYGSGQELFLLLRVGSPAYILESGEVWRLITPIFLHFSVLHLVFNMLMLWVFGRVIEARGELLLLVLLIFGSAVFSNIAQYYVTGSGFGGMSGVVFAVLAYCWLWDRLRPAQAYGFPNALMALMIVWLALGYTDFLRWAGFGSMANTAHLAGLLFGLVFAWWASLLRRPLRS